MKQKTNMDGSDRHIRSIHIIRNVSILNLTFDLPFLALTLTPPTSPPASAPPAPPAPHHADPASDCSSQADSLAYVHRNAYPWDMFWGIPPQAKHVGIGVENCGTHKPRTYSLEEIKRKEGEGLMAPIILPIISLGWPCQGIVQSNPALSARFWMQCYVWLDKRIKI